MERKGAFGASQCVDLSIEYVLYISVNSIHMRVRDVEQRTNEFMVGTHRNLEILNFAKFEFDSNETKAIN